MSEKLYIRQVNPEYQESPIDYDDDSMFDGIAVYGNPRMNPHIGIPEVDTISRNFDEAAADYDYYIRGRSYDTDESEESCTMPEILERYGLIRKTAYTEAELKEWASLFNSTQYYDSCDEEVFLPALQLMTGKVYNRLTICGCCQGDWQYIVYPLDDWDMDAIRAFEAEYFNTGSEWIVDDGDFDPESENPGEISGVSYYLTEYDEDKIRAFFANVYRWNPADIVLYKWTGTRRVDTYAAV